MLFNQKEIIMPSSYVIKKSKEIIKNTLVVTLILINYRGTAKKLNSTRQAAVVVPLYRLLRKIIRTNMPCGVCSLYCSPFSSSYGSLLLTVYK